MIDVKKLVIGFLVLAVAASASALMVSGIGNTIAANSTAITNSGVAAGSPITPITGSAFLPAAPSDASDTFVADIDTTADPAANDPALASSTAAIMADPNNLTNILANNYLNNLALTNPNGPSTDASGNQTLTPPDDTSVINQFVSSSTNANLQVPDWDTEADQVPITVVSSSANALASYGVALSAILQQDVVQTNLQNMLNNNSDPSFEPFVSGKVQTALQDISGLKTPASAVALQKSLIKTFVYAKNILALGENASGDPLKAELIIGAEGSKYDAAVQDLQTQIQNAQSQNLFSLATEQPSQNHVVADIQSFLGIPTANAQIPVTDVAAVGGIWATVANMIKAEIKDVVLQLLKNALVFIMQKTIFAAIKGSGAPAFIQQWGNTLATAFQQSALNALNSQMQCVGAAPFQAQLRLTLKASYPANNNVCAVQFQSQLGNNLNTFYNNFSNGGGWATFGSTLQPDYNYYGSINVIAQTVGNTAQNSQNAAQAKAIASQGFTGSAVCDDGSNPNGVTYNCYNANDSFYNKTATCPAGYQLQTFPNNGSCSDGTEPQIQTPGTTFNNMANSAISGNFELIASANSWEGLATGLFVSILQETLNSLAQSTISDANGLLQQAYNGGGANTVTNTGGGNYTATAATGPQPITCYVTPTSDGNPNTFQLNATGGETISTNPSTPITTPSYTWVPPAGGSISATAGDTVVATFDATGTYQVVVTDAPDGTTGLCTVSIPWIPE